jgi:hypothetical protein
MFFVRLYLSNKYAMQNDSLEALFGVRLRSDYMYLIIQANPSNSYRGIDDA